MNLVQLNGLNKTESILIKGFASKSNPLITDVNQIQAVISALDTNLMGLADVSPPRPQDFSPADNVLVVFNLAGDKAIGFSYNLKAGYLTSDTGDYRVPAPANLRATLGL